MNTKASYRKQCLFGVLFRGLHSTTVGTASEKFSPAADRTHRETQSQYAEGETLEHSALKRMSPSNPSPQGSENAVEEEAERM